MPSTKDNPTYHDNLGWPNIQRETPIVEDANGEAWVSINGVIRVFPDHWKSDHDDLRPVPPGTQVVTLKGVLYIT